MTINNSLYKYLIDHFRTVSHDPDQSVPALFNIVEMAVSDGHPESKAIEMVRNLVGNEPASLAAMERVERAFSMPRPTHDTADITPQYVPG